MSGGGLIARVGGKSKQKQHIFKRWLPIENYDTYVEPFLGGGNIAMDAPVVKKMIAGDNDTNLINIYKDFLSIDPDIFRNFDFTKPTKKKWLALKALKTGDPIKRLYASLYVLGRSYVQKGQSYSNARPNEYVNLKKNIEKYQEILGNYTILHEDYKKLINKYDSPTTFFYLDPPYYNVYSGVYESGEIKHEELFKLLDNIKGYFLLSYNDAPYIRKLYKDYHITKFISQQTDIVSGGARLVSELLISNYN